MIIRDEAGTTLFETVVDMTETSLVKKAVERGRSLENAVLSHYNLENIDFSNYKYLRRAVWSGGIISSCNFANVNMSRSVMIYTDFIDCNFHNTSLYESDMTGCTFTRCNLDGCAMADSIVKAAYFVDCTVKRKLLTNCSMEILLSDGGYIYMIRSDRAITYNNDYCGPKATEIRNHSVWWK